MTVLMYVVCGLVGWWPPIPLPKPEPIPKEDFFKNAILGLVGGAAGGSLVYFAIGLSGPIQGIDFVVVLIGAAATGKIFQGFGGVDW